MFHGISDRKLKFDNECRISVPLFIREILGEEIKIKKEREFNRNIIIMVPEEKA